MTNGYSYLIDFIRVELNLAQLKGPESSISPLRTAVTILYLWVERTRVNFPYRNELQITHQENVG